MSDKLESLYRIKIEAQLLQNNRSSPDIGEVLAVQAEIDRLVELFYAECRGLVGTEEYHQARGDFDCFLRLIDRAIGQCREREDG